MVLTDKERIENINSLNKIAGDLMRFAHEIRSAKRVIRIGPGEIAASLLVHPVRTECAPSKATLNKDSSGPTKSAFYSRCEHKLPTYRVSVQQIRCVTSGEVFVG